MTSSIVWLFLAGIGALAAGPIGAAGGAAGVSGIGLGPGAGGGIVAGPAGGLGLVGGVWGFWLGSIKIFTSLAYNHILTRLTVNGIELN
jgi:hypothetical protein